MKTRDSIVIARGDWNCGLSTLRILFSLFEIYVSRSLRYRCLLCP
ncbi:hypothetical protein MNBD_DELTA03-1596 [hydrothermal vent metagenome]|uniref:Uncharacterized protein n=1 Tax=hydrothermal vent metagenome TaxID=652676 RepID=A0A3B0V6X4_9ZZZZ